MSEPVKEPTREAWLLQAPLTMPYDVAAAFQKFIDANKANADAFEKLSDGYLQRAEAAEANLVEMSTRVRRWVFQWRPDADAAAELSAIVDEYVKPRVQR